MEFTITLEQIIGVVFTTLSIGALVYIVHEIGVMKGRELGREDYHESVKYYIPWTDEYKKRNAKWEDILKKS